MNKKTYSNKLKGGDIMLSLWKRDRDIFDSLFDEFKLPLTQNGNLMRTDIKETDHSYQLHVEMPGFKKEDVKVSIDDGYLTIEAERQSDEKDEKDGKFLRRERYSGVIKRRFYVGQVKLDDLHGEFVDGILKLDIPKETKQLTSKKYLELK